MKRFLVMVSLAALAACSSLVAPQSIDEGLAYAQGEVTALEQSALTALNAKAISPAVATQVLTYGDQVTAAISAAKVAEGAGDTATAQGKLALATSLLAQLVAYLQANGVK